MSDRAQKILTWLQQNPHPDPLPEGEGISIRQQTLAEQFGCSRRSIGRALKELKEAGLLIDLNKRHQNRCKMYRHCKEPQATWQSSKVQQTNGLLRSDRNDEASRYDAGLTPQAQRLWDLYEKTFRIVFKMPELPTYFAQVTSGLQDIKEEQELWHKTWAGLWAMGL